MSQINAYLHFNANCREAMTFYQECLGGELTMQTMGESPLSDQMPGEMSSHILHAALKKEGLSLLGSDLGASRRVEGNAVSLMLDCNSKDEINTIFSRLSVGGQIHHSLENTFWGATFGDLTDSYGFHWYLNFDKNQPS